MKLGFLAVATLAASIAFHPVTTNAPALALDLDTLKTRTILGLRGPAGGAGISNQVLGSTPLSHEGHGSLADRNLRTRYWKINGNGGIVPIHNHAQRPAVFTILTGEIWEYVNTAPERVLHRAGGLALEEGAISHWWLNEGDEDVYLIAFDVYLPPEDMRMVDVRIPQAASQERPETTEATLELLGAVDIGKHFSGERGEGLALTTWRATIEPGGVLGDFTGSGEPLQTFVWQGSVTEFRIGADPVLLERESGTAFAEGATGWWENTGTEPAILYFGAVERLESIADVPRSGPLAHGEHR